MGYQGEELRSVPEGLSFSTIYAVIVSGDFPNPCGHALLYIPFQRDLSAGGGHYFQIAGGYRYPHIMNRSGYARYIRENDKTEITRHAVPLGNPGGAQTRLEELVGTEWLWAVLPHNCAAFVEDIARAGGSSAGLWSNCPRAEEFDRPFYETVPERINEGLNELDRYIRWRAGVPF